MQARRIVVLGLYNSGSTVLAGMLHRMGVNMGPPFWRNPRDGHEENFYESRQLSHQLRQWWAEPLGIERVSAPYRIGFLKTWAALQEKMSRAPVGAKHPLLSLSAFDLASAWGGGTCFIRAWRSMEESLDGLRRRAWFPGHEIALQKKLWEALESFERGHSVNRFDWNNVKSDPAQTARDLARAASLSPTGDQLAAAAALFRSPAARPLAA